jgi:sulfur carrier protein
MSNEKNGNNSMINICFNGQQQSVTAGCSIQQVTSHLADKEFVIALNQHFIPRSQYSTTQLQEGDAIELLSPMAGG